MRRFNNWNQRTATVEETPKGFYNPPQMMDFTFNRKTYTVQLSAGTSDYVEVYRDGDSLFVLSYNYRLGYVGLQVFALKGDYAGELMGEIFEQSPDENEDLKGWEDMAPFTLIKILANYVEV